MAQKRNTRVVLIENGFQQDYMVNLISGLSKHCDVLFVGSDAFLKYQFDSNVSFLNLRGSHEEHVTIFNKVFRVARYYFKLFLLLLKTDIGVVHIQWLRFYLIDGVFFPLLLRLIGKKVVYTVHDVLPHDKDHFFNRVLFRFIYKCQNVLIAHSEFIKQRLINEFQISEKKIYLIEHGVYQVKENSIITFQGARKFLNLNENDFVFLFFGRIAKYKGIELLISCFNKLKLGHDRIKLIIAGKLASDYKKGFETFFEKQDHKGIINIICFIEEDEVELIFNAANVTVLPYSEASQSGVLFLSYAYGVPVIAPDLGSFPNYVKNGETGLIYKSEIESDLQASLKTSLKIFEGNCDKRKQNIKDFASQNYSWDVSCKKLFDIYQQKEKKL